MSTDDPQQPRDRNGEPVEAGDDVILSEATAAPGRQVPAPSAPLTAHDMATPYVLDALTPEEREAYEVHLADCEACQAHVAELRAVAGLLPDALVIPPADLPDAFPYLLRDVAHETLPFTATAPAARDEEPADEPDGEAPDEPVVDEAGETDNADDFTPAEDLADSEPADEDIADADEQPEPDPRDEHRDRQPAAEADDLIDETEGIAASRAPQAVRLPRPPGRIRPGVRAPADAADLPAARTGLRASPVMIALALLGVVAIGLFLWALLLQGRVNDLEDEIDAQNAELASIRQQANATSYTLLPTLDGPEGASGIFFFSLPEQSGALVVRGLAAAPDGQAYQLWYIDDGEESTPTAGPVFQVDANGEAVVPLSANVTTFDAVALSLEPEDGSDAPTTLLLLQGRLGGAAG